MSADRGAPAGTAVIRVDRVACTGHGICAQLLPDDFGLDEWGYPVVRQAEISDNNADLAVRLCPARALYLS